MVTRLQDWIEMVMKFKFDLKHWKVNRKKLAEVN